MLSAQIRTEHRLGWASNMASVPGFCMDIQFW